MPAADAHTRPRVAVLGAGLAGLCCAHHLERLGADVLLLEASPRPGGVIRTVHTDDGFLLELGPNSLLGREPALPSLLEDLGLGDQIIAANPDARNRFVLRDRRPIALPISPGQLPTSPIISTTAKLRLLAEPLVGRGEEDIEESLANFVRRRFGQEILDYLVDPFCAGTFAGLPRRLSSHHALSKLHEFEEETGSVLLGAIKGLRARRRAPAAETGPQAPPLFTLKRGVEQLIDALVASIAGDVRLNAPVVGLRRRGGGGEGWQVQLEAGVTEEADAVVSTLPLWALGALGLEGLGADEELLERLDRVWYPPVAVVELGFGRDQVAHPLDGFGMLIPGVEHFNTLGVIFGSTLFEGRAPTGKVLLSCRIGGARQPELVERSDEELTEMALCDLDVALGVRGDPVMTHIARWPRAIPQYEVAYDQVLEALDRLERQNPGLRFVGNYRGGIAVPDVVKNARNTARALFESLPPRAPR